jgi:hypothetical protein
MPKGGQKFFEVLGVFESLWQCPTRSVKSETATREPILVKPSSSAESNQDTRKRTFNFALDGLATDNRPTGNLPE